MTLSKLAFIASITICAVAAFPSSAQTQSKPGAFKSYVSPQEPLQRNEKRMMVQRGTVNQQQRTKRGDERLSRARSTSNTTEPSLGSKNTTDKQAAQYGARDVNDSSQNKSTSTPTPEIPAVPSQQNNATPTSTAPLLPGTTPMPTSTAPNATTSPFEPKKKTPFVNSLKEYQDAQSTTDQK
jgi:hypothetical protein